MIMIDHAKFLSTRFDLVVRYYLLEECNFNAKKARYLIVEGDRHKHLRGVFGQLLKVDVGEKLSVRRKVKDRGIPEKGYGHRVAEKLFSIPNWSWVERRMMEGDKWIRENPYPVMPNGLGTSAKRFVLALKHGRSLYWLFAGKKSQLRLWTQSEYRRLMRPDDYREIKNAKSRMVRRMGELGFFSIYTYVGDKGLLP